eukprot:scaffold202673_cov22-Tisochrysis_lutea.AAC.4
MALPAFDVAVHALNGGLDGLVQLEHGLDDLGAVAWSSRPGRRGGQGAGQKGSSMLARVPNADAAGAGSCSSSAHTCTHVHSSM